MRISDWSSDVCSSDLRQWIGRRGRAPGQPQGQRPRSKSGVARIMFLNPMLFAAALFTTPATPQTVVDDLLNVDRSFSSAAAATDPASGLATMLDADAVTPVPGNGIVEGRDAVTAVLRSSLLARGDKIGWTPIRGGVSAGGRDRKSVVSG